MYTTDQYEGLIAETIVIPGHNGDLINAYLARPLGPGPFPGMVLAHNIFGFAPWYKDTARKYAYQGYLAICPNLFHREGPGTPEDVAAKARAAGGIADDQAVGDLAAAMRYLKSLPSSNGKVGIFGTCSGGRHAYLTGCRTPGFDAVVDCWGGRVVAAPTDLTPKAPVAPIDYTKDLACPLLGIFGNDDRGPNPDQVNQHEAELKRLGKQYEFHRYDGAGHGFFYHDRANYRQEQAVDAWQKLFAFLEGHLGTPGAGK